MKFINKDDNILGTTNFIHDCFDAFFKLATILGSSDHQGEVESNQTLVREDFGHDARGDFLSKTFDNRGLADTGFSDEHWVILGAAA